MSVEIYSKGRAGTPDDPIIGGQYATFTARIDGREAWQVSGYGYQWRSDPQLQSFGSDNHTVSFRLPDYQQARTFEVILNLMGGGQSGAYKKTFWVEPLPQPLPQPPIEGSDDDPSTPSEGPKVAVFFTEGDTEKADIPVDIFDIARAENQVYQKGLFFPKWYYNGDLEGFNEKFSKASVDPSPNPSTNPYPNPSATQEQEQEQEQEYKTIVVSEILEALQEFEERVKEILDGN